MPHLNELDFVIIDLETTGLYVDRGDRVIEVGAVKVRKGKLMEQETFHSMVNPGMQLTAESTAIHGITNEELENQPTIDLVAPKLQDFMAGSIPVAQNAKFDLSFLRHVASTTNCPRIHVPFLDTMLISKNILFHYTTGHNLDAISKRLKVVNKWDRHRSLGDCFLTGTCLIEMFRELENLGKSQLKDLDTCFVDLPKIAQSNSGETLNLF